MTERQRCIEHDRSAEFVKTNQKRVCWAGLVNPEAECLLAPVHAYIEGGCVTQREDIMRAALERIRGAEGVTRGVVSASWVTSVASEALAEVDALPENDTEARLAQIAELLALVCEDVALEDAHIALSIARGEEPS